MRRLLWIGLGALAALLVVTGPTLYAQLQQSGGPGSTVTIGTALPAGGNTIGGVNVVAALPTGGNTIGNVGVTSLPALPTGSNAIGSVTVTTMPALATGSNTIGVVVPKTPCGATVANQALAAVPTSSTTVFAATTCLMRLYINNTNASAQTVTITDNQGTPAQRDRPHILRARALEHGHTLRWGAVHSRGEVGGGRDWNHGRHVGIPMMARRLWLIVLGLALATGGVLAQQNVSGPSQLDYAGGRATVFTCGFNAVAATLTQCQAAPAAGLKLYVTSLHIQTTTTTSGTYALQTGTGTNCGTGTAALFPVSGTANRFNAPVTTSGMDTVVFPVALAAPAASALCVIGVATNTVSGQIVGFTAP